MLGDSVLKTRSWMAGLVVMGVLLCAPIMANAHESESSCGSVGEQGEGACRVPMPVHPEGRA